MCGGESKRMGTDKGLLEVDRIPWAKIISNLYDSLGIPYVLSINEPQFERYSNIFNSDQLVIDNELNVKGPLKGLLSVFEKYPSHDLLLMACDMIDMEIITLKHLVDSYVSSQHYNFYVYERQNFLEPFCGIYTSQGLRAVDKKAQEEGFQLFSLQSILQRGKTMKLSIINSNNFRNYNHPDQY